MSAGNVQVVRAASQVPVVVIDTRTRHASSLQQTAVAPFTSHSLEVLLAGLQAARRSRLSAAS